MMTILKDMGIQQWRLRRSAAEITTSEALSSPVKPPVQVGQINSEHVKPQPHVDVVERTIWPSAPKEAADSQLTSSTESDKTQQKPRPSIAPVPRPVGAKSQSPESRVGSNNIAPMPAPMPAPIASSEYQSTVVSHDDFYSAPPLNEIDLNQPGFDQAVMPNTNPLATMGWDDLQGLVNGWQHCPTCGDEKSLLGHGDVNADWLFVNDAPSSAEITQSQLFAGRSGQLFEAILSALGLDRSRVYSTSLFKCIASDDMSVIPACDNILERQIQLIQPKIIVTFGEFAAQTLLKANANLEVLRTQQQQCINSKVTVIPTFAPAQMLDDASLKSKVWNDLKKAISIVNLPS